MASTPTRLLLDATETWLCQTLTTVSHKSDTTAAILYALNQCEALMASSRSITQWRSALSGVALGRTNFLFAGADWDGKRAAAIYSLIGTAKGNGVDPKAYLRHVLDRIAEYPINCIDDLLPCHVASDLRSFTANA